MPAAPRDARWNRLVALIQAQFLPELWRVQGSSPSEEAAFWQQQRAADFRTFRFWLVGLALITLMWWPTDPFVFHHDAASLHTMSAVRIMAVVMWLGGASLVSIVRPLRLRASAAFVVLGGLGCLGSALIMGERGGPGTFWFHCLDALVIVPMSISLRPWQRAAATAIWIVGLIVGFFGFHPEHWNDPLALASVSYLAAVGVVAVGAGMVLDGWRRRTFFLRLATERQAEELRKWSELLESRVKEQTVELRTLTAYRETSREQERAHIARELHDELGQELTALSFAVELARLRYRNGAGSIEPNLQDVDGLVGRMRDTIRSIIIDLRPRVLDDLGLGAATEWLVRRTGERTGVECRLELPAGDLKRTDEVATAIFRIVQESLTNMARHAKATHVVVRLKEESGVIELEVRDDGVGFVRSPAPTRSSGMGLVGMRERASSMGGTLEVESAPGKGTCVRARFMPEVLKEVA